MIVCRVQAHPSRADLHARLLPLLRPLPTEVLLHESDPPDPWAGYQQCLRSIPDDASHAVVLQDDAIPCAGFPDAITRVAARWPDTPVCLFLGGYPAETATRVRRANPDVRYVPLGPSPFVPLVAVLWPTHVARAFLYWSRSARRMTRADDGNAARWKRLTKAEVMVTVPSLVEHDDSAPSTKGGRKHEPWTEKWRFALSVATHGADYEW